MIYKEKKALKSEKKTENGNNKNFSKK